jgi:hypothetical protein
MHQRGNTELPCPAPLSYWIPLRNGPSGSLIIKTVRKYKSHRKQVGLLPEGDHQGRPLAHTKKRLARVMAQLPESCGAEVGKLLLLPVPPRILHSVEFRDRDKRNSNQSRTRCWRTMSHTLQLG